MAKQTTKSKHDKGKDALQSLLSGQAEARLQREISFSKSDNVSKSSVKGDVYESRAEKVSENDAKTGPDNMIKPSGIRKSPSMQETKAQLIGRMEKLLSEMDKIEARLEQKNLELERAKKVNQDLTVKFDNSRSAKGELEAELTRINELLEKSTQKHKSLEALVLELEKASKKMTAENKNLGQKISGLELENKNHKAQMQGKDTRLLEVSSLLDNARALVADKNRENESLKQHILRLEEDNHQLSSQVAEGRETPVAEQKRNEAWQWRNKANELWEGTGYSAPQKAVNYLNAALAVKPSWPEAINDRGLAYMDDYQLEKALEDFTTAIALKNDFAEAYHNRGVALLKSGKTYAARKDFQMAATHGLWLGMNLMMTPPEGPGIFFRIKLLLGKGGKK